VHRALQTQLRRFQFFAHGTKVAHCAFMYRYREELNRCEHISKLCRIEFFAQDATKLCTTYLYRPLFKLLLAHLSVQQTLLVYSLQGCCDTLWANAFRTHWLHIMVGLRFVRPGLPRCSELDLLKH